MLHRLISVKLLLPLFSVAVLFSACLKDPDFGDTNPDSDNARARIEITDAPVDNPNVKGVFVTVADIKIDGESWKGFDGKMTVDLLALQSGQTELLGEGDLKAGTHSQIVLVLDTEEDEDGDSPGCYVLDALGNKRELSTDNEMSLQVRGNFTTTADQTTTAVIDVDLRKAIIHRTGSTTQYQFVTTSELKDAVRIVDKSTTGTIEGNLTDGVSASDKVIVYAYHKGDFDTDERLPQGTSQVTFQNAVSSAVVQEDGSFTLPYLESGNYEIRFVSYGEDDEGILQARGELQMTVLGTTAINLLGINVKEKETVDVDIKVASLVFF